MKNPSAQLLVVLVLGPLLAILAEALFGAAHPTFTAAWALWCGLLTWASGRSVLHQYRQSARETPMARIFGNGVGSRLLVGAATLGVCSAFGFVCLCVVTIQRLLG